MNEIGVEGGRIGNRRDEIFDARSDQITTRIFEVLELIFPPDFLEEKKTGKRGSPGPPTSARQCDGGSSLAAAVAAVAAQRRCRARWRQAMGGERVRATAIYGAGQEGGTTREQREAMRQPAGREVPKRFDR